MVLRSFNSLPPDMKNERVRIYYDRLKKKPMALILKRVFDCLLAFSALVILSPVFLVIGVLIKVDSSGPIMFRQTRVTRYGKKFRIYKFRTMITDAEGKGLQVTTKNDFRITRIGRILRKYRIDEIPQLINIIKGDMTFVGPRPEVVKYVEQYSDEMLATLLLPAGITSEASIRFKDEERYLTDAKSADYTYVSVVLPLKMEINLKALENFSFFGDIKIIFQTMIALFHTKGTTKRDFTKRIMKRNNTKRVTKRDFTKRIMKRNKTKRATKRDYAKRTMKRDYKLVALLTNNDDDIYCFRKELIEHLYKENYHILISCPYGKKLDLMKDTPYIYDDVHIDRRGTNIKKDFKLYLHYRKLFKYHKPDVVLLYTAKPNIYGSIAAKQQKIPYINNVTGLGSVIKKNFILKNLIFALFRIAFKKSNCVFFQNSENLQMALGKKLIKGKYKLIPGSGVNTERFPLMPYPDDSNGIVFNYIGRVMKDKGIEDYLEVAKRIKKENPLTEFNILGFIEPTEQHYQKVLDELKNQGFVNYLGSQIDVRPYITCAHAIIHPSNYGEGMSNVLLENASSGRPVITTNIAGCREIVNDNITGFIYTAGDVDQLESKIKAFINLTNEDRKNMGFAGREKVRDEFNREKVITAYMGEIVRIF